MRRRPRQQRPFSITYVPVATDGGPDQVLTIENHTDVSVLPTLAFTAFDIYGRELPHVVTQTVHGSHRGGPLLPAGGSLRDILRFDGQGSRQVRGVQVELAAVEELVEVESGASAIVARSPSTEGSCPGPWIRSFSMSPDSSTQRPSVAMPMGTTS